MAVNQLILDELKALGDDLRARLDGLDRRIEALEGGASAASLPASVPELSFAVAEEQGESRTVAVKVSPLHDVSRVRVVEKALAEIEGVDSVSLLELYGDAAHLEVKVHGDVPLIGGLRKTLQVAFDVSESHGSSFTIALAQPRVGREDGVAVHSAS